MTGYMHYAAHTNRWMQDANATRSGPGRQPSPVVLYRPGSRRQTQAIHGAIFYMVIALLTLAADRESTSHV